MKRVLTIILLLALALTGCDKSTFANRLTTTLTGDRLFVNSLYGPVGLTAELAPEDAAEIRKLLQLRPTVPVLLMPVTLEPKR